MLEDVFQIVLFLLVVQFGVQGELGAFLLLY